jgi:hypothetical protein
MASKSTFDIFWEKEKPVLNNRAMIKTSLFM